MGRSPCCAKEGLNRGAWTALEDKILTEYIQLHGEGRWRNLPKKAGLKRCGKSCRLRWLNYLRPDIKRGNISPDEEELIIRLHKLLGNRWSLIAGRLPGRTDNEIKNYWNTNLGKKVQDSSSLAAKKGKTTMDQLSPNMASSPSPISKTVSHVVRTKAAKCTKVFINPPLPHKPLLGHQYDHQQYCHDQTNRDSFTTTKPMDDHHDLPNMYMNINGSSSSSSLLALADQENSSSEFMADFDIASLLNSDFSSGGDEHLSPYSAGQTPLMFSEELMLQQHWNNGSDDNVVHDQPNLVLNFHSLTSFLDAADQGEWLGE